ncbi:MAG: restriction endonuclease subunit S [Candidatus Krumholzibacteriota bacterium]|nr:restriction endonuclease subunit S [Candidatus Krumholzibacteriota bacterium]
MSSITPDGWRKAKLGANVKVQGGYAFKSENFMEQGIPIIRISNIKDGLIDLSDVVHYMDCNIPNEFVVRNGDVLVAMSGATTGKTGKYRIKNRAFLNQRVGLFRILANGNMDKIFLYYVTARNEFTRNLLINAIGGAQPNVSGKQIEEINILIPPLSEQRKIASILSSVDSCIETTEAMIAKLQNLKKALMQELLTKGLPPKVAAKYGIKKGGKFKDSSLGKIPEEWEVAKLENVCVRVTDGTHDTPKPSKYGFHLVTSKNLRDGRIEIKNSYMISNHDYHEVNKRSKVDAGDVLFGMIGTVGNPVVVEERDLPFAIKNVGLFKTNGDFVLSQWLFYYLSSPSFLKSLDTQLSGSSQRFVGLGFLRELRVPKTRRKEMNIIVQLLNSIQYKISNVKKCCKKLQDLKKALMQDLLTGKVRVKVDDVA